MKYPHRINRSRILGTSVIMMGACILFVFGCKSETDGENVANQNPAPVAATIDASATSHHKVGYIAQANQDDDSGSKPQQEKSTDSKTEAQEPDATKDKTPEPEWTGKPVRLLGNDSLDGWELLNFGGEGDCEVENGVLTLEAGDPFTGVSSTRDDLPKTNYEISLTARKTQGIDFFCGLTFPVAESHCTLIVGGWGGGLVGLSCIDDLDASRNDTESIMRFEQKKWYKIRVRVERERISAWIDDKQVVNQDIVGKKISLRGDITLCRPLGVCSFQTDAEIKDLQIRRFKKVEPGTPSPDPSLPKSNPDK